MCVCYYLFIHLNANPSLDASHTHIKHVVHAHVSDNGYPLTRADGNVLFTRASPSALTLDGGSVTTLHSTPLLLIFVVLMRIDIHLSIELRTLTRA